jgi:hypothetical protein
MDEDEKLPPLPPFKDHGSDCSHHKQSYLEDPMTSPKDRELMVRILDNYSDETLAASAT